MVDLSPHDVPCGTCRACCRGDIVVMYSDNPDDYLTAPLEGHPLGSRKLGQNPDGTCVYLSPKGCSIYERRPTICKAFDCRRFARAFDRETPEAQAEVIAAGHIRMDVIEAGRARC